MAGDHDDDWDRLHQLVIYSPISRRSESPVRFEPAPGAGLVRSVWTEQQAVVDGTLAGLLGLPAGTPMAQRTRQALVNGEPVLLCHSYLPPVLVDDQNRQDWHHVRVGQLALPETSGLTVRPTAAEERSRMPTRAEAAALQITPEGPVLALYLRFRLTIADGATVPAGLVIVARADRVYLRFGAETRAHSSHE